MSSPAASTPAYFVPPEIAHLNNAIAKQRSDNMHLSQPGKGEVLPLAASHATLADLLLQKASLRILGGSGDGINHENAGLLKKRIADLVGDTGNKNTLFLDAIIKANQPSPDDPLQTALNALPDGYPKDELNKWKIGLANDSKELTLRAAQVFLLAQKQGIEDILDDQRFTANGLKDAKIKALESSRKPQPDTIAHDIGRVNHLLADVRDSLKQANDNICASLRFARAALAPKSQAVE